MEEKGIHKEERDLEELLAVTGQSISHVKNYRRLRQDGQFA